MGLNLALMGAAGAGFMRGVRESEDRDFDRRTREEELQWRREQREMARMQNQREKAAWDREDKLRDELSKVGDAAPVATMQAIPETMDARDIGTLGAASPVTQYSARGRNFATMGDAQKAAAATPQEIAQRTQMAYMRAGMADKASAVQANANQAELAQLGLDKSRREAAVERYMAGVSSWVDLPKAHKAYDDGTEITSLIEDGKGGATVKFTGADGEGKMHFATINDYRAFLLGKINPQFAIQQEEKRQARMERDADRAWQRDIQERGLTLQEKTAAANIANQQAARAEAGARMSMAREAHNAQMAALKSGGGLVWPKEADATLLDMNVVKDENTGQKMPDGAAIQFQKGLAVAAARSNGGDVTSALGKAFEVDQKLRAASIVGPDGKPNPKGVYSPDVHNALRAQYQGLVTGRIKPQPPAPAGQPQGVPQRPTPQPSMQRVPITPTSGYEIPYMVAP